MTHSVYLRYEVLRNFRDWRYLIFSFVFPLVLFFVVASVNRQHSFDGIAFPLYFMTAMATLGTMSVVISSGARIAAERAAGWTRQLRITPLRPSTDLAAKVVCAYLIVVPTLVLLYLAGASLGVRLAASQWLEMTGLILAGLVPFVILGFVLGYLLPVDAMTPALGGIVVLFSLFGGVYGFELAKSGPMFDVMKALPSYWLVQAGKTAFGGGSWPAQGWIVIAAWTAVLVGAATLAYRRSAVRG